LAAVAAETMCLQNWPQQNKTNMHVKSMPSKCCYVVTGWWQSLPITAFAKPITAEQDRPTCPELAFQTSFVAHTCAQKYVHMYVYEKKTKCLLGGRGCRHCVSVCSCTHCTTKHMNMSRVCCAKKKTFHDP
jgi:hypothetical protein